MGFVPPPPIEFFKELKRVAKNYIIWGANYFEWVWPSKCYIVWDKRQIQIPFRNMGDSELAVCSFDSVSRTARIIWDGFSKGSESGNPKIHPTQKPIALYSWLLKNYAKRGDKILDTHLGSGSHRIAAYKLGFDFTGFELDKEYYDAQEARFKAAIAMPLFDAPDSEQTSLL